MKDIYCDQILSGKLKVDIILETDKVMAFHHTQPYWEQHVVIIPKAHIDSLSSYPVNQEFIKNQYSTGVNNYVEFTTQVGLWESEKYVFEKYLKKTDHILDLGCGTGRTTFPLATLGYDNIIGVDLTPAMIDKAKELNNHFSVDIQFQVGDATSLDFPDAHFDSLIFSFNGLMSIPKIENRYKVVSEINRVLKPSSIFIFTTHDRDKEEQFLQFWKDERTRWENGKQNTVLYEFGDLITHSKNESREIFIHIHAQRKWIRNN